MIRLSIAIPASVLAALALLGRRADAVRVDAPVTAAQDAATPGALDPIGSLDLELGFAQGYGLLDAAPDAPVMPAPTPAPRPWKLPPAGERFAPLVERAAVEHGVPFEILGRVLNRESRFRDDVIEGRVVSSAGALGVAQFMPATARELGVDPLDPASAIPGAARYLRKLYDQFGDWTRAVAAYNWGPGNVARKGLAQAPAETRAYLAEVLPS